MLHLHALLLAGTALAAASSTDIYFRTQDGPVEEDTIRQGKTAAHVYLDSSAEPYFFVAFPAGNSGAGLWFRGKGFTLEETARPQPLDNGDLHGVTLELKADAHSLRIADSVLGSMRFLRDRELGVTIPKDVQTPPAHPEGRELHLVRRSLNGLAAYELDVEAIGDTRLGEAGGDFTLDSPTSVRFRVRALTSEPPVTPIEPSAIFQAKFLRSLDSARVKAFSFLLSREKLMAGSPRYLTKFGRDSVYTLHALIPVLRPEALESELVAILSSAHPTRGWISHETSEGDFASFDRKKRQVDTAGVTEPLEDYKMVDEDFAFAALAAEYLNHYPKRAAAFLRRKDARGLSVKTLLENNFRLVIDSTAAFAQHPEYRNLIRLRGGEPVGNWRDSENGLGGGVYPFDVNAAFVPAALHELAQVYSSRSSGFRDENIAKRLREAYDTWSTKVIPLFLVHIPAKDVPAAAETYWKELGQGAGPLPPAPPGDIEFPALSLADDGKPVPIQSSDDSLVLAFTQPGLDYLRTIPVRYGRPYPYGLVTPVGLLISNPMFAPKLWRERFDETRYHGRVIWGMQENFLLLGLNRQLARRDLDSALRAALEETRNAVAKAAEARDKGAAVEHLSLHFRNGKAFAEPFAGDAKANSNQLWSHLRMLIKPAK